MAEYTYDIALSKIAALCSQSEKCEYDAMEYLQKKGLSPQQCNQAVEYLVKNNYIDNLRFAKAFARDKAKFNKWGTAKISLALTRKKIDPQTIKTALENLPDDFIKEIIISETTKKAKTIKDLQQPQSKAKLLRFCAGRGYPMSLSLNIIEQIINNYQNN